MRPAQTIDLAEKLDGSLIVSATFELADGTRFPGYVTPRGNDATTMGDLQPQIVTEKGQVMFWYGRCPLQTQHAYVLLNRDALSVLPIRFKTDIPINGTQFVGEIPGFFCLNDDLESITIVT